MACRLAGPFPAAGRWPVGWPACAAPPAASPGRVCRAGIPGLPGCARRAAARHRAFARPPRPASRCPARRPDAPAAAISRRFAGRRRHRLRRRFTGPPPPAGHHRAPPGPGPSGPGARPGTGSSRRRLLHCRFRPRLHSYAAAVCQPFRPPPLDSFYQFAPAALPFCFWLHRTGPAQLRLLDQPGHRHRNRQQHRQPSPPPASPALWATTPHRQARLASIAVCAAAFCRSRAFAAFFAHYLQQQHLLPALPPFALTPGVSAGRLFRLPPALQFAVYARLPICRRRFASSFPRPLH